MGTKALTAKKNVVEIAKEFSRRIRALPGVENAHVYLFGSAARGDMDSDSDIDLLVVLDVYNKMIDTAISEAAFRLGLERDVLISELVYSRERFESALFHATPLYENIIKEGVIF